MVELKSNLQGRVAAITGGSGVLCRAMAIELARHGVRVAILNRTLENGQKVVDEIVQRGGTAMAVACDVLDMESVKQAEQRVSEAWGPCDLLINGAGGNDARANTTNEMLQVDDIENPAMQSLFDLSPEGFSYVMDLNTLGTWIPTQVFTRSMVGREGVTVINISSVVSPRSLTKIPAYSAAKAAIDNMTKWLAVHFADAGIRVNAIAPGFFLTEQNRRLLTQEDGSLTERSQKIIAHTPMKRFGEPEDLLGTLLWLVDERMSRFVNGITVPVDGGFLAYSGV